MNENVTLAREPRTDPTGTIVDMTVDAMASAVTRVVPTGKATAIVVVRHPRAGTETGIGIGTADIGEETTTAVDHEIPIEIESAGHDGETTIEIDQGGEVETKSTETVTGQRLTEGEDPQSLAAAPHVEIEVLNLTAAGVIINLLPMPGHPRRAGKRSDGRGVTRIPDLHTSQNTQHLSIQSRRLITNPNLRSNDMTGKNQTLLKIWLALFRLRRTENPLHRFVRVAGAPTKLARVISTPISPRTTILRLISSPMTINYCQIGQLDALSRASKRGKMTGTWPLRPCATVPGGNKKERRDYGRQA